MSKLLAFLFKTEQRTKKNGFMIRDNGENIELTDESVIKEIKLQNYKMGEK